MHHLLKFSVDASDVNMSYCDAMKACHVPHCFRCELCYVFDLPTSVKALLLMTGLNLWCRLAYLILQGFACLVFGYVVKDVETCIYAV